MNISITNNTEKKQNKALSSSTDSVLKELEDLIDHYVNTNDAIYMLERLHTIKTKKTNKIVKAMNESKGRFFGLKTSQGENLNAQFIRETPKYVLVRDRNSTKIRKFAKTSLKSFSMGVVQV